MWLNPMFTLVILPVHSINHISKQVLKIKSTLLYYSICVKGPCHLKSRHHSNFVTSTTNVVAGVTYLSETNVHSLLDE